MEEQYKLLIAFCTVVLNKPQADVEALLAKGDEGLTEMKDAFTAFSKTKLDEGVSKTLGIFKRQFKAVTGEEVDISKPEFKDALTKYKETLKAENAETEPKAIDDATVKGSEPYKKLQTELTEEKTRNADLLKSHQRELMNRDISGVALQLLTESKAIIPTDKETADYRQNLYLNEVLGDYDFEKQADGSFHLKNKEGEYVENANKHRLTLAEHAKDIARKIYGLQQAQQRQNAQPGNAANPNGGTNGNQPGKAYTGNLPTTESDYFKLLASNDLNGAQKREIRDYWQHQQQPQT